MMARLAGTGADRYFPSHLPFFVTNSRLAANQIGSISSESFDLPLQPLFEQWLSVQIPEIKKNEIAIGGGIGGKRIFDLFMIGISN